MAKGKGKRYQAQRETFCQALAMRKSPVEAGKIAGYKGAANCRRNAQRADVKARVNELLAPARAKLQAELEITVKTLTTHLVPMAFADLDPADLRYDHKIKSLIELAKLHGVYAPDKHALTDAEGKGPAIFNVSYRVEPKPTEPDRT